MFLFAKFGSLETEYKSLKSDGRLVGMNFSEDIKIEMKDFLSQAFFNFSQWAGTIPSQIPVAKQLEAT